MNDQTIIVWFTEDLRLDDNPAFFAACEKAKYLIPIYIFDDISVGNWPMGSASRWWLDQSLAALQTQLKSHQSDLLFFQGESSAVLNQIISDSKADAVYWNRIYTPALIKRDKKIKTDLSEIDVEAISFEGNTLLEPWKLMNQSGSPYKVFTPFWKRLKENLISQLPSVCPQSAISPQLPENLPNSQSLKSLRLYDSSVDWAVGFQQYWTPGGKGACVAKAAFIESEIKQYTENRDLPYVDGTSRLSAHLHFGEISVKRLWLDINQALPKQSQLQREQMWSYLRQLAWREFSQYLLFHFDEIDQKPFRSEFAKFPWVDDYQLLAKWQQGKTGYPLVDAGMRQLWQTGWMHNRVRMVCASFLTKHLLIHWRHGALWFWDTLVDANLANNSCGWQWVAGCGADAAPFFRIFNPITQSKKFDPKGDYIRRWVPELSGLDGKFIHEPWLADDAMLETSGVELGANYPHIVIEHSVARQRALAAYSQLRQ